MTKNFLKRVALAASLVAVTGCFTEPGPLLDEFTWEGVTNQAEITEGVTIAALFRDISFLGQAKTPTLCYGVAANLSVDGTTVTLNVDITSSGSGTCAQTPGGVRYTGVVRNLAKGTYTVHIIQKTTGVGVQEFTQEVTL